jgi:1-deoxy-D-xylulose-5-phosphate synthase
VGSAILELISERNIHIQLISYEYEDIYVQHGDTKLLEEDMGILPEQIAKNFKKEKKYETVSY